MKTYDPTKSLRQMFFMPNVVPLSGIFIAILFTFLSSYPGEICGSALVIPEAQFVQAEQEGLFSIFITKDGVVYAEDERIDNISTIHSIIKQDSNYKYLHKALIKADQDVEFGRVQEVLKEIKKAEVDTVGLIVNYVGS